MRKTPVLLRQHIGWHFAKHWVLQGKRKPLDTGAEKILKSKGIAVCKPEDIINEKKESKKIEIVDCFDRPPPLDETHPNWHDEILLSYKDDNVLLEGLSQAKIITNTVEVRQGLPERIQSNELSEDINEAAKTIIMNSHLLDAEQKKLPKVKDPERPAWNFPRTYGITQGRRNKLITSKLLNLIESTSGHQLTKERYLFEDLFFSFPFERNGMLLQFQLSGDFVLTSSKPLSPISEESTENLELPDIYPVDPMITLNNENIYETRSIYPINPNIKKSHPHTLFIHFDREVVKNLFEEVVTDNQIFGRSLLKTFTVAASYARQKYGDDVKNLPKPVTLQSVQTDGRFFHLGVLQLNTLDLEGTRRNLWYQTPLQYLFDNCGYKVGRPRLEGYNSKVIKQLYGFYNSV
ncbi:mitochondrial ribosomal protein L37 [Leptinotarsa decemlineata]|uniref:mitochondrial ribosomal protein L37 n=1 Tax=Leptinotarsa decemlineata TaxID=7539 RepID=UPI003D3048EA